MNTDYHVEHHLHPNVPFFQLPALGHEVRLTDSSLILDCGKLTWS
jgi:fatty acid desaturase